MLIADIGGTNTRCAVASPAGTVSDIASLRNAQYSSLPVLLAQYLDSLPRASRPTTAMLAIAAPIRGDVIQMINIGWQFSQRELQRTLGLTSLRCLNDFEALTWALPVLGPDDLVQVGSGSAAVGTKAVLGPGTGLGVASLVRTGEGWQAVAGEGGHVTLAAYDDQEERIIRTARERFGHCSAERLVSGPGLSLLYEALGGGSGLEATAIGERATGGDSSAKAAFEAFFRLLGTVAANLALTVGASGGIYIGGGIVKQYVEEFGQSGFRERFETKGRYRTYMQAIPTWVITRRHPTLLGLASFARQR